ncbi:MAG: TolC family protein [candidate division WOR-3 bacterium]
MSLHLLPILIIVAFSQQLPETLNLSLDSAVRVALRQSPVRTETEVAHSQAAISTAQAINALLPAPSATLSHGTSRTQNPLIPESTITTRGWTGALTLSQIVFDPQTFASAAGRFIYADYYTTQAQEYRARLVLDVTTDYLNLLKARMLRVAAASALRRAEENLVLTSCRETPGAISQLELLRAERVAGIRQE